MMADTDESELLDRLKAGDARAFELMVRGRSGPMLAVARRILNNDDDAADALQDAFVSVFQAIGKFDGRSALSTWLHRVVVNAALMKLRKRRRIETSIEGLLPRFSEDDHHADPPSPWTAEPAKLLAQQETRAIVRKKIDQLPDSYRTVLLLRDIEGFDTAETAQLLELTESVVKVRLHRARQALRTLLDPLLRGDRT